MEWRLPHKDISAQTVKPIVPNCQGMRRDGETSRYNVNNMTDEKQLRKKGENTRKKEEKKEKKANALREHWG